MASTVPGWMALSRNSRPTPMIKIAFAVTIGALSVVWICLRVSLRCSRLSAMPRRAVTRDPPLRVETTSVEISTPVSRERTRSRNSCRAASTDAPNRSRSVIRTSSVRTGSASSRLATPSAVGSDRPA